MELQINLTGGAITALCTVVGIIGTGTALYVRRTVTIALLQFEKRLLRSLGSRYVDTAVCKERREGYGRRLAVLESRAGIS